MILKTQASDFFSDISFKTYLWYGHNYIFYKIFDWILEFEILLTILTDNI